MLAQALKAALPPPLRAALRDIRRWARDARAHEFRLDRKRYTRHAVRGEWVLSRLTSVQLEAQLTRDAHRVEKGLALAAPRRPFGREPAERLDALIPVAEALAPTAEYLRNARTAREGLERWNREGVVDDAVAPEADPPPNRMSDVATFFGSRHSVRDFSDRPVDDSVLRHAVELAGLSPSVCNREPWRVRLYHGADVPRMLAHQHGSTGMRESVPALALISVELGHFFGATERNQAWIEGGIFSASLMWALHGMGLDTCMLNLSITNAEADRLRAESRMPDSEVPIMMMAIGHGRPGHRVARSPRRGAAGLIDE